jgi:RNA polymerase sigma-70 factor (ECF subfamily)
MNSNVSGQSDMDLIESARHGSMEAFAVLYQHYHGAIKAYAFSLVKDKDLAEDVAQEVFAVACKDLKRLKKP